MTCVSLLPCCPYRDSEPGMSIASIAAILTKQCNNHEKWNEIKISDIQNPCNRYYQKHIYCKLIAI